MPCVFCLSKVLRSHLEFALLSSRKAHLLFNFPVLGTLLYLWPSSLSVLKPYKCWLVRKIDSSFFGFLFGCFLNLNELYIGKIYLPNLRVTHRKYICLGKNVLTIQWFVCINRWILLNFQVLECFLMLYLTRRICKV